MNWFILVLAGLFEIAWAIGLKQSDGFSRPLPTLITIACMVVSVVLLGIAVRTLPVGTAYAVWTGIGAVGVAIVGMTFLGEPKSLARIACIFLIAVGIVGLKLLAKPEVSSTSEATYEGR